MAAGRGGMSGPLMAGDMAAPHAASAWTWLWGNYVCLFRHVHMFPEAAECRHLPVGLSLSPIGWKQCYVIGSSLSIQLALPHWRLRSSGVGPCVCSSQVLSMAPPETGGPWLLSAVSRLGRVSTHGHPCVSSSADQLPGLVESGSGTHLSQSQPTVHQQEPL